MAYNASLNPVRAVVNFGIVVAQGSSQCDTLFIYQSSHYSSDITSTANGGFFQGCGAYGAGSAAVGMSIGDLLLNIAPGGLCSWHTVTSISTSTAAANLGTGNNPSSLNVVVSAATS